MTLDRPGIYSNVPLSEYVTDRLCPQPSLSSGIAHTIITQSPLHARECHPRLNPDYKSEEKQIFDIGTAAHEALLQGLDRVAPLPWDDWRKKEAREYRDKVRAAGGIPLLEKHYKPLEQMVTVAKDFIAHSEIAGVFDSGEAEQTVIWREAELWMRSRPDWLAGDQSVILHYKTTTNANPDAFIRGPLVSFGYDMTLAFYERGFQCFDGASVILAQETCPPYSCSLIGLDPAMADLAARKVERAIKLWRLCMETGVWPSYPGRIAYAEPKPWQVAEQDEVEYRGLIIDPVQAKEGLTA